MSKKERSLKQAGKKLSSLCDYRFSVCLVQDISDNLGNLISHLALPEGNVDRESKNSASRPNSLCNQRHITSL